MMLEFNGFFQSTGSSGSLGTQSANFGAVETIVYFQNDTIATTQSIRVDTAPESTGPWVLEASTSISTVGSTSGRFRITGPFGYIRAYLQTASTGDYRVWMIGVR